MFIDPIQVGSIGSKSIFGNQEAQKKQGGFSDVFKDAWTLAADNQDDLAKKQYLQSIGEIEDTHTVPIAASKAELSLNLLVTLRNKALESYNELIRMSV